MSYQQNYAQPPEEPFQPPAQQHKPPETSDSGSFGNITWIVQHRNTNSTVTINVPQGDVIKARPGAMIHMTPSITLQGKVKVSLRKLFTGGQMAEASYAGPGQVAFAPMMLGDVVTLNLEPGSMWYVPHHAYLARTGEVTMETRSQGFGRGLGSGGSVFIYNMAGRGVAWLTSFGAIETRHLEPGEQHIVEHGHLVAWDCNYSVENAGGGFWTSVKTGEGTVCRFTGPGTIYIGTRNLLHFQEWVCGVAAGGY